MKTWGEMGKQEKLDILEAMLDGKEVEAFCLGYEREVLVKAWRKSRIRFYLEDIPVRIKQNDV